MASVPSVAVPVAASGFPAAGGADSRRPPPSSVAAADKVTGSFLFSLSLFLTSNPIQEPSLFRSAVFAEQSGARIAGEVSIGSPIYSNFAEQLEWQERPRSAERRHRGSAAAASRLWGSNGHAQGGEEGAIGDVRAAAARVRRDRHPRRRQGLARAHGEDGDQRGHVRRHISSKCLHAVRGVPGCAQPVRPNA